MADYTTLATISPVTLTNAVATPLSASSIRTSSLIMEADESNTGKIYFGDSSVTTLRGISLSPGQSLSLGFDQVYGGNNKIDLSTIYFDTATTGNKVRVTYIRWSNQ